VAVAVEVTVAVTGGGGARQEARSKLNVINKAKHLFMDRFPGRFPIDFIGN
jgi:hypothetical protein